MDVIEREWTIEKLNDVWSLPDEPDHWEWMAHGRTPGGVQMWAAVVLDHDYGDPEIASIVYIGANGWPCCECSAETRPSLAVVLAVVSVHLGLDSREELARALDVRAEGLEAASRDQGCGSNTAMKRAARALGAMTEARSCADLLRRGTVEP